MSTVRATHHTNSRRSSSSTRTVLALLGRSYTTHTYVVRAIYYQVLIRTISSSIVRACMYTGMDRSIDLYVQTVQDIYIE